MDVLHRKARLQGGRRQSWGVPEEGRGTAGVNLSSLPSYVNRSEKATEEEQCETSPVCSW